MRLSEAIRLGAMVRPQAFRTLLTDDGACALGAALLAVGAGPERIAAAFSQWPWAFAVSANCPSCRRSRRVCEVIAHLNDDHRWTREKIGAWVAGVEPPDALPPEDVHSPASRSRLLLPAGPRAARGARRSWTHNDAVSVSCSEAGSRLRWLSASLPWLPRWSSAVSS